MATVGKGYTFGATETVTNTKLHTLVTDATVTGIVDADIAAGAAIDSTKLDLTGSGYVTTGGDNSFTGTNTFSDVDINDGTLDGVQIGGTTATGEIIVNDSSDSADGLGDQGTSGETLHSAGAGSNPTWAKVDLSDSDQVTGTPSGVAQIDTGTYTGDGNATQAVTGVGFTPKFVMVGRKTGSDTNPYTHHIFVDSMDSGYSIFANYSADGNGSYTNDDGGISAVGSGSFTVRKDSDAAQSSNENGVTYWYLAIG